MKQTEQPTVVVNLKKVLADRIWTEFRNDLKHQDIAKNFFDAIQVGVQKNKQAPDEALIPVTVHVTWKQARTILDAFKPWAGFPHDRMVYQAVDEAMGRE